MSLHSLTFDVKTVWWFNRQSARDIKHCVIHPSIHLLTSAMFGMAFGENQEHKLTAQCLQHRLSLLVTGAHFNSEVNTFLTSRTGGGWNCDLLQAVAVLQLALVAIISPLNF